MSFLAFGFVVIFGLIIFILLWLGQKFLNLWNEARGINYA